MKKIVIAVLMLVVIISVAGASYSKVLVRDKSVVKIGEDINMGQDMSFEDLVAIQGNINVKGTTAGDVVAVLGSVHLFPTAKVGGDVVSIGGTVTRNEGAKVGGKITEIVVSKEGANMMTACAPMIGIIGIGGFLVLKVLMLIGFFALAAVLVSFKTNQLGVISSIIEKKWLKTLLWGILGYILICPIAMLLAITIVGIPLILIEAVLVSLGLIMGFLAASQLIGKKFTKAIRKPNQPMLTEVIYGIVLLFLIELVPVIGPLVKWVVVTMGFGSAIITKLGTKA